MQKKIFLLGLFFLIALLLVVGFFMPDETKENNLTGELATLSSNPGSFSKTIAVCNSSNFCQDYKIICRNEEELERIPVPGATIQKPPEWVDDRGLDYENLCG